MLGGRLQAALLALVVGVKDGDWTSLELQLEQVEFVHEHDKGCGLQDLLGVDGSKEIQGFP